MYTYKTYTLMQQLYNYLIYNYNINLSGEGLWTHASREFSVDFLNKKKFRPLFKVNK